jgi:hypothetical protein
MVPTTTTAIRHRIRRICCHWFIHVCHICYDISFMETIDHKVTSRVMPFVMHQCSPPPHTIV